MKRLLPVFALLNSLSAFATTYYYSSASLSDLNNWWSNENLTGSHPVDFDQPLDTFCIKSGINATSRNWGISGHLKLDGTIELTGIVQVKGNIFGNGMFSGIGELSLNGTMPQLLNLKSSQSINKLMVDNLSGVIIESNIAINRRTL